MILVIYKIYIMVPTFKKKNYILCVLENNNLINVVLSTYNNLI